MADRQVIKGEDPSKWGSQVTNYINESVRKGKDIVVLAQDGDPLTITRDTAGKAQFRNDVRLSDGTTRPMTDDEYAVKLRAETHIDELSKVSKRGKKLFLIAKITISLGMDLIIVQRILWILIVLIIA